MNSYKILGVTSRSSKAEIKLAFLKKAKILHPDALTGNEDKFKELLTAYELLKDKKVIQNEDVEINFRDITRNYERPARRDEKREWGPTRTVKVEEKTAIRKSTLIQSVFVLSISLYLFMLGNSEDGYSSDFQSDYLKNSSKVADEIYESSKSSIKY